MLRGDLWNSFHFKIYFKNTIKLSSSGTSYATMQSGGRNVNIDIKLSIYLNVIYCYYCNFGLQTERNGIYRRRADFEFTAT